MHYYSSQKDSKNLNVKNKEKNVKLNYESILSHPPNYNIFLDDKNNNNNAQYLLYNFQNKIGLNPIGDDDFNFDSQLDIKIVKGNNKKEVINKKVGLLNKHIINEKKYNKNIKFLVKKENLAIHNCIQLDENLENKNFEFNNYPNNYLNNNAYSKYLLNQKKKNEQKNINKTINNKKLCNFSFSQNKIELIKHKRKHNDLNSDNNKQINKKDYKELTNSINSKTPVNKYCYFPKSKNLNQRTNINIPSFINFNSNPKSNNNISNTYLKDNLNDLNNIDNKKNLYKNSIHYCMKEDKKVINEYNNKNKFEKNMTKSSFTPQIFESQNSSTMIGGIEYTTLLIPKRYLEKIKAKLYPQ